jgi:hypothetical protein
MLESSVAPSVHQTPVPNGGASASADQVSFAMS